MNALTPRRAVRLLVPALAAVTALAGCGGEPDGRFDAQAGTPSPSCIQHQSQDPGSAYTGREKSDPKSVLEMMRFYTANGTKTYCDGRPPTDTDRHWTELYTALGGDAVHVTTG
ncbi:hypothetical protein ACFXPX_30075 [Kitasatospora sp. NPDC059146]|uniref:hypothetical protein n=1 Tax=unclassified Kitasatospora TaxID=2633591 RepID=UPI003683A0A2